MRSQETGKIREQYLEANFAQSDCEERFLVQANTLFFPFSLLGNNVHAGRRCGASLKNEAARGADSRPSPRVFAPRGTSRARENPRRKK